MTIDAANLLKQLGLGVPAIHGPGSLGQPSAPMGAGQVGFAELLDKARSGELTSNLPIQIDPDSGVSLTDEQLARLSLAADQAEAAGIRTALVILDDQQVVLDVHMRVVTGKADVGAGPVGGIDGVINLSEGLVRKDVAAVKPPGGLPLENAAITKLLEAISE